MGNIVDVWTVTQYRRQGIASNMIRILMEQLEGQHIYLFADKAIDLYTKLGFQPQPTGLGKVVGEWLKNDSLDSSV